MLDISGRSNGSVVLKQSMPRNILTKTMLFIVTFLGNSCPFDITEMVTQREGEKKASR